MFLSKWCKACPDMASIFLRITIGITFIMHGSQKVFGAFDGGGISGTALFLAKIGIPMPELMAYVVAFTEFLGGIGILLGCCTRFFALLISILMLVAIVKVHWANGFFMDIGGIEYPFIILGATLSLFSTGCTKWGMDCTVLKKWCK
jgi:putative oxidoreductase